LASSIEFQRFRITLRGWGGFLSENKTKTLTENSETLQDEGLETDALKSENTKTFMRILIVEDETKVARALKEGLEGEHYDVVVAKTGEEGFFRANAEMFDLVVLDLMLPGRDGIEVLTTLRKRGVQIPVLILTAKDDIEDRVLGLDSGADDYLVKPFAFPELLARIRALLRRGRIDQVLRFKAGDLEMDLVTRRVTRGNRTLDLTSREFELLEYLLRHRNQLVSREMLTREVWKEPSRATPLDNVIDVHITRLRKKVDQDFPVKLIHTVRGVGFILREDEP
jgi:two-component system copper resistance phosphate regulon response regulator CusR